MLSLFDQRYVLSCCSLWNRWVHQPDPPCCWFKYSSDKTYHRADKEETKPMMSSAISALMKPREPTLRQAFDITGPELHCRVSAGRCDHKPLKTQSHREFCQECNRDMTTDSRQTGEDAERPQLFRWRTQSHRIYKILYKVIGFNLKKKKIRILVCVASIPH